MTVQRDVYGLPTRPGTDGPGYTLSNDKGVTGLIRDNRPLSEVEDPPAAPPAPGHPVDTDRLKYGVGPLTNRLCELPPRSALPSQYAYVGIRDYAGNAWWLIVGEMKNGVYEPVPDVGAMLRNFAFGVHPIAAPGQRTKKELDAGIGDREKVDLPYTEQFIENQGQDKDARARAIFDACRFAAWQSLGFVANDDEKITACNYGNPSELDTVTQTLFPATWDNGESGYRNTAKTWRPGYTWTGREGSRKIVLTDAAAEAAKAYRRQGDNPRRASMVGSIPLSFMPIPPVDFRGEWRALGCAWSRVAILVEYDRSSYPNEWFDRSLLARKALLDEARTVEIVKQSFKAVGDVVNGILTYNFTPLTESLTDAVNGPALKNVREMEIKLIEVSDKLQRAGFNYGRIATEIATGKKQPETTGPGADATPAVDNKLLIAAGLAALFLL